ncbi:MAG: ABC transporter permease subunit [Solirubrobacteraceae bacterium]|nr:ABC transporter permease subunit [Patulibacter sp.]
MSNVITTAIARVREPWSDRQATVLLGAVACFVLVLIGAMIIFIVHAAWPSLSANGLGIFTGGHDVDKQLGSMLVTGQHPPKSAYHLNAWPYVYATILIAGVAVLGGLVIAVFASVFIVEFAPERVRRVLVPTVRLLAAVPSVVFGLIGILVLVPFIDHDLLSTKRQESVTHLVQLDGTGVMVSIIVLAIMVTPLMIALTVEALRAIPHGWKEGAAALGANRWEAIWGVSVRAARPAIISAAVLAASRALGEAVMLSMISGSRGWSPNPLDGLTYLFEPLRPLAAAIVENVDGLNAPAVKSSIYVFATILLFSSLLLSIGSYLARLPLRRQGVRV